MAGDCLSRKKYKINEIADKDRLNFELLIERSA